MALHATICQLPFVQESRPGPGPGTGGISGVVALSGGTGIMANILIDGADSGVNSDPVTGAYIVSGLSVGSHSVSAQASGFTMSPATQNVIVIAGVNQQANQITATPSTQVSQVLVQPVDSVTNQPVTNASAILGSYRGNYDTTKGGIFFPNVPYASYVLNVIAPGYLLYINNVTINQP